MVFCSVNLSPQGDIIQMNYTIIHPGYRINGDLAKHAVRNIRCFRRVGSEIYFGHSNTYVMEQKYAIIEPSKYIYAQAGVVIQPNNDDYVYRSAHGLT